MPSSLDELHTFLIKFRVLSVAGFIFSCWLLKDAWGFYKLHYLELATIDASAGIAAFIAGFIGLVKYTLENVARKHEGHEQ